MIAIYEMIDIADEISVVTALTSNYRNDITGNSGMITTLDNTIRIVRNTLLLLLLFEHLVWLQHKINNTVTLVMISRMGISDMKNSTGMRVMNGMSGTTATKGGTVIILLLLCSGFYGRNTKSGSYGMIDISDRSNRTIRTHHHGINTMTDIILVLNRKFVFPRTLK